eukprot:14649-Heterococcus_DN1.PRE.1
MYKHTFSPALSASSSIVQGLPSSVCSSSINNSSCISGSGRKTFSSLVQHPIAKMRAALATHQSLLLLQQQSSLRRWRCGWCSARNADHYVTAHRATVSAHIAMFELQSQQTYADLCKGLAAVLSYHACCHSHKAAVRVSQYSPLVQCAQYSTEIHMMHAKSQCTAALTSSACPERQPTPGR